MQPDRRRPEPDPYRQAARGQEPSRSQQPKPLTPQVRRQLSPPTAEDPFHPAAPESYKNPAALIY